VSSTLAIDAAVFTTAQARPAFATLVNISRARMRSSLQTLFSAKGDKERVRTCRATISFGEGQLGNCLVYRVYSRLATTSFAAGG